MPWHQNSTRFSLHILRQWTKGYICRRAITGPLSYMVQSCNALRIDEDISTSLAHVPLGLLGETTACKLPEAGPPGAGSPDIAETCLQHPMSSVHLARLIDQERPVEPSVPRIAVGQETRFEGYCHYLNIQLLKFLFLMLQLQQIPPVRR